MREELIMLTAPEPDVENYRPTNFPEPRKLYARVRYPSIAVRVQAYAIAYMPKRGRSGSSSRSPRFSVRTECG